MLRGYLQKLKKDQSFEITHADEAFERTDETISANIDIVITGHTHQEKALRRHGGGMYYNSGTWVRLIQLEDEVLDSDAQSTKAFDAFSNGSMTVLDQCQAPPLVKRKPTVASIVTMSNTTMAALNHVEAVAGKPNAPKLSVVSGSEFTR